MKNSAIFVISAILVGALAVAAYTMSNDTTTELDGVQQSAAEALNATEPAAGALDNFETSEETNFQATSVATEADMDVDAEIDAKTDAAVEEIEATADKAAADMEATSDAAVEEVEEAADEAHDEATH